VSPEEAPDFELADAAGAAVGTAVDSALTLAWARTTATPKVAVTLETKATTRAPCEGCRRRLRFGVASRIDPLEPVAVVEGGAEGGAGIVGVVGHGVPVSGRSRFMGGPDPVRAPVRYMAGPCACAAYLPYEKPRPSP
jgi:hypothetical protein